MRVRVQMTVDEEIFLVVQLDVQKVFRSGVQIDFLYFFSPLDLQTFFYCNINNDISLAYSRVL